MGMNTFGDKVIMAGIVLLFISGLIMGIVLLSHGAINIRNNKNTKTISTYNVIIQIPITKSLGGNWNIGKISFLKTSPGIPKKVYYNVFGDIGDLLGLNSNVMVKGSMKNIDGNMAISTGKLHFGLYGTKTVSLNFNQIGIGEKYIPVEIIENNQVVANKIFQIKVGE